MGERQASLRDGDPCSGPRAHLHTPVRVHWAVQLAVSCSGRRPASWGPSAELVCMGHTCSDFYVTRLPHGLLSRACVLQFASRGPGADMTEKQPQSHFFRPCGRLRPGRLLTQPLGQPLVYPAGRWAPGLRRCSGAPPAAGRYAQFTEGWDSAGLGERDSAGLGGLWTRLTSLSDSRGTSACPVAIAGQAG